MTGWRALQAAPRGRVCVLWLLIGTGEIRTHTASCLKRLPLPLGYGAARSGSGWTRTTDRLLVRKLPLPLGHGTEGIRKCGSRGTRTHNELTPAPVFKTGSSSGRMTSRNVIRQEPTSDLRRGSADLSAGCCQVCGVSVEQFAGAGIEPANSWFKATDFYQQKLPRRMSRRHRPRRPQERLTQFSLRHKWVNRSCTNGPHL